MKSLEALAKRLDRREARIAVVGLGYVGLPAACMLAAAGFSVVGLDLKADRVDLIGNGQNPILGKEPGLDELLREVVASRRLQATTDADKLRGVEAVLICVETPVDDDHRPRYHALRAACVTVARRLTPGVMVVVESTISPGTTEQLVKPTLEQESGLRAGEDFGVGHCPERVMPGRLLLNMRSMARVLGADEAPTRRAMRALYSSFVEGLLDDSDVLTAELVKTAENAYRDVQIAFANQLALVCEAARGDVWTVRELVNRSPGRNVLYPGPGVGGHCIPKDSWLMAAPLGDDASGSLLAAARRLNDSMPVVAADLVASVLREFGAEGGTVAVLGAAYLENSDDTRNAPTIPFLAALAQRGLTALVHDPWVEEHQGELETVLRRSDAAVILVAHDEYRQMDLGRLAATLRRPVLVDTRAVVDPERARAAGLTYRRLGTVDRRR